METCWGLDFVLGFGGEISDPSVLEPSDPESQCVASMSYGRNLRRSLTLVSVSFHTCSFPYDAVNSVWGTDFESFQGYVIETGTEYSSDRMRASFGGVLTEDVAGYIDLGKLSVRNTSKCYCTW